MTNLNLSSTNTSRKFSLLALVIALFAFIGFIDAAYLTVKFYLGGPIPCAIFTGCDTVARSSYSAIFGIPIALPGALYYAAIFFLAVLYLDLRREWIVRLTTSLTLLGFVISLYLVYLQIFVLEAICLYCMVSAADSTLLFVLSLVMLRGLENKKLKINE